MSYYEGFQLPSTHLGPGDINPAYSSVQGLGESHSSAVEALGSVLGLALLASPVMIAYGSHKRGNSVTRSAVYFIGSGIAIPVVTVLGALLFPPALFAVPAASAYYAFKD